MEHAVRFKIICLLVMHVILSQRKEILVKRLKIILRFCWRKQDEKIYVTDYYVGNIRNHSSYSVVDNG